MLERLGIRLIGAQLPSILMAEDRSNFRQAMHGDRPAHAALGVRDRRSSRPRPCSRRSACPRSSGRASRSAARAARSRRPRRSSRRSSRWGLHLSPRGEVLVEESVLGWKEFELEVMRDKADNVVIICSIENFDPMGVHTGDSITVAPAQTLTDKEYQRMRDAAIAIIRKIGVETGGSNIQFAVNPANGDMTVIEMNPRVSRSSALASKATGFPIAKIAAKLAIGYTLDEIPNDITRSTPASFEPTIDYVVTKIPRFTFEKFPQADRAARRADEVGRRSDGDRAHVPRVAAEGHPLARDRPLRLRGGRGATTRRSRSCLREPGPDRLWAVGEAFRRGRTLEQVNASTAIDPWFLWHVREIIAEEARFEDPGDARPRDAPSAPASRTAASRSSRARPRTRSAPSACARASRRCTSASTPAAPSSRRTRRTCTRPTTRSARRAPSDRKKIIILGGGPNRIGQGIEFDYCCVHGLMGLAKDGYETIMVNCNPETVSTDYDSSDRLYFEPLTLEDVLAIVAVEKPQGVIVQFGGQTPLRLAVPLARAGVPIIGTIARRDRPRRGPRALLRAAHQARPAPDRERHRAQRRGGARARRAHRLSGAGAAVVRARRPRDADRARHARARDLHARGGAGLARAPGAGRPLPRQRDRGRRRRALRRQAGRDRRHHGAHRGGRHPLRRLGLLAAALQPAALPDRRDRARDARARARARRRRPDERAVRDRRRRGVRARGESRAPRAPCRSSRRRSAARSRSSPRA